MPPSYRELQRQIKTLEMQAQKARKAEIAKTFSEIRQVIALHGFTPAELGLTIKDGKSSAPKKLHLVPKYQDPASGTTWSGHGKRPQWFLKAEEKGLTDALLIKKPVAKTPAKTAKPSPKPVAAKKATVPKKVAIAKPPAVKSPVAKGKKAPVKAAKKPSSKPKPTTSARPAGAPPT